MKASTVKASLLSAEAWPELDHAPARLASVVARCVCGCPDSFHLPDLDGAGLRETPARGPCSGCGCHRWRP